MSIVLTVCGSVGLWECLLCSGVVKDSILALEW